MSWLALRMASWISSSHSTADGSWVSWKSTRKHVQKLSVHSICVSSSRRSCTVCMQLPLSDITGGSSSGYMHMQSSCPRPLNTVHCVKLAALPFNSHEKLQSNRHVVTPAPPAPLEQENTTKRPKDVRNVTNRCVSSSVDSTGSPLRPQYCIQPCNITDCSYTQLHPDGALCLCSKRAAAALKSPVKQAAVWFHLLLLLLLAVLRPFSSCEEVCVCVCVCVKEVGGLHGYLILQIAYAWGGEVSVSEHLQQHAACSSSSGRTSSIFIVNRAVPVRALITVCTFAHGALIAICGR